MRQKWPPSKRYHSLCFPLATNKQNQELKYSEYALLPNVQMSLMGGIRLVRSTWYTITAVSNIAFFVWYTILKCCVLCVLCFVFFCFLGQVAAAQEALERGEDGAAERLAAAEEELERALEAVLDAECAGGGGFGGETQESAVPRNYDGLTIVV